MVVRNLHTRRLPGTPEEAGALIDTLASDHDRLWPRDSWPPVQFDRPLGVGARGGHGMIRYDVTGYAPGKWVCFRFTGPEGANGFHEFAVHTGEKQGEVELHHLLVVTPGGSMRLGWPLVIRWLHDACIEDLLDRAEREITGTVRKPARWSWWVRTLLTIMKRRATA